MSEDGRVHLEVALEPDLQTIQGTIDDGVRPVIRFTGWLELMSAFEIACTRAGGAIPRAR